jgi:hypothetical protein
MKNNNVKDTVNEFMIDILGSLVPGVIFLISVIISVIIPVIIIYSGTDSQSVDNTNTTGVMLYPYLQGWFWLVLFFTFLILAYAVGNLFFRLDIKVVDRASFKYQRKKYYKELKKVFALKDKDFCSEYRNTLFFHLHEEDRIDIITKKTEQWEELYQNEPQDKPQNEPQNESQNEPKVTNKMLLNYIASQIYTNRNKPLNTYSKENYDNIINEVRPKIFDFMGKPKLSKKKKKIQDDKLASGLFFLFALRSEIACDSEENCQFPYEHYNTYLIKRGEEDLIQYAKWCTSKDTRTKNALNKLKLEISNKAPKNQSIIIRNEAHIRMASSSFFATRYMIILTPALAIILLSLGIYYGFNKTDFDINTRSIWLSFILQVVVLAFNWFLHSQIIRFLHYQRLREIFFVLQIYSGLKKSSVS